VTVVADEARVIVSAFDVVWNDVVLVAAARRDLERKVRQGDVRVTANPTVVDDPKIPVIAPSDLAVIERRGRRDGEEIPDPGVVLDREGASMSRSGHFAGSTAAYIGSSPRLAREQRPNAPIGVYPEHRHVGGLLGAKVDPCHVATMIDALPIGPHADAAGRARTRGGLLAASRCGLDCRVRKGENEQPPQGDEHESSKRIHSIRAGGVPLWPTLLTRDWRKP
jgi:hypothetical protein